MYLCQVVFGFVVVSLEAREGEEGAGEIGLRRLHRRKQRLHWATSHKRGNIGRSAQHLTSWTLIGNETTSNKSFPL